MTFPKKLAISTLACSAYWATMSAFGDPNAGHFALGLWSGYFIADASPLVRWWRIRRYRKYAEAQRVKQAPRSQPWDVRGR